MASAVIVRAHLPEGLESLRRRSVADAAEGVPAHITLLYPFIEWSGETREVRLAIAAVAERHEPIAYRLTGPHRWPDTIYAAVEPAEPFVQLQADLAAAFPAYPIYGEPAGFDFVPHVTVAEGAAVADPRTVDDPAWAALPIGAIGAQLEVIASDGARWDLVWSLPLGHPGGRSRR